MKDPVCGRDVAESSDSLILEGKKYFFCCASCKWAFENDPNQFLGKENEN